MPNFKRNRSTPVETFIATRKALGQQRAADDKLDGTARKNAGRNALSRYIAGAPVPGQGTGVVTPGRTNGSAVPQHDAGIKVTPTTPGPDQPPPPPPTGGSSYYSNLARHMAGAPGGAGAEVAAGAMEKHFTSIAEAREALAAKEKYLAEIAGRKGVAETGAIGRAGAAKTAAGGRLDAARLAAKSRVEAARITGGSRENAAKTSAGARTTSATTGAGAKVASAKISAATKTVSAKTTVGSRVEAAKVTGGSREKAATTRNEGAAEVARIRNKGAAEVATTRAGGAKDVANINQTGATERSNITAKTAAMGQKLDAYDKALDAIAAGTPIQTANQFLSKLGLPVLNQKAIDAIPALAKRAKSLNLSDRQTTAFVLAGLEGKSGAEALQIAQQVPGDITNAGTVKTADGVVPTGVQDGKFITGDPVGALPPAKPSLETDMNHNVYSVQGNEATPVKIPGGAEGEVGGGHDLDTPLRSFTAGGGRSAQQTAMIIRTAEWLAGHRAAAQSREVTHADPALRQSDRHRLPTLRPGHRRGSGEPQPSA